MTRRSTPRSSSRTTRSAPAGARSSSRADGHAHHPPWAERELIVLRRHYPRGGAPAVHERLPHRSDVAIRAMASHLGIRHNTAPARDLSKTAVQKALRATHGNLAAAARLLGFNTMALRRRALALGVVTQKTVAPWRQSEIALLRAHYATGGLNAARSALSGRSSSAIKKMAERLGLSRRRAPDVPQRR